MARRKIMLVNALDLEEVRVAVLRDDDGGGGRDGASDGCVLDQIYFESRSKGPLAGSIYKGRIANFERSLDAAFVDLGSGKHGFLHASDVALEVLSGRPRRGARVSEGEEGDRDTRVRELLAGGREIIVQVRKEGVGEKGPSLTTFLGLPGRYLVLMPHLKRIGVSKRITERALREELKRMLAELRPLEGLGFVIRTEARGVDAEEIRRDADRLLDRWHAITEKARGTPAPALLWAEADLVERAVRDYLTAETAEVWVDSPEAYARVRDYLASHAPRLADSCHVHTGSEPLFHRFGVEEQMQALLAHEVRLPGGGEIVIEQTEAMVVVDVNSARSRHRSGNAAMILETNLEAAREIARQLRLRDLGGLVVVDFIDMEDPGDRTKVEQEMRKALEPDKARSTLLPISEFGLLEMTRQRRGETLEGRTTERCPHCAGRGFIRSVEALSLAFLRDLRAGIREESDSRAAGADETSPRMLRIVARFRADRALSVANRLRMEIGRLEASRTARVHIESDPDLGPDQYRLEVEHGPGLGEPARASPGGSGAGAAAEAGPAAGADTPAKRSRRRRRRGRRRRPKTTEGT